MPFSQVGIIHDGTSGEDEQISVRQCQHPFLADYADLFLNESGECRESRHALQKLANAVESSAGDGDFATDEIDATIRAHLEQDPKHSKLDKMIAYSFGTVSREKEYLAIGLSFF